MRPAPKGGKVLPRPELVSVDVAHNYEQWLQVRVGPFVVAILKQPVAFDDTHNLLHAVSDVSVMWIQNEFRSRVTSGSRVGSHERCGSRVRGIGTWESVEFVRWRVCDE